MTAQEVEKNLEKLLKKLSLPKQITVDDVKDIIWNEQKPSGSSRLYSFLVPYVNDPTTIDELIRTLQDAWNYFPHRVLGGKSPNDLVNEYQQTGKIDTAKQILLPKKGESLPDIFEDQYPKTVVFEKMSDDTWGWSFPKLYHALTEQLWELEETRISKDVFEKQLYKMIKRMPELFDAVNNLAKIYGVKREFGLAKILYEQTIVKARSYIPDSFTPGKDRIIWAYMENRPFLRLLAGYAMFIEEFENREKAIPLYEELLTFNPSDNQGIRCLLATAYLKNNQAENVLHLKSYYPDDALPETVMGTLLALIALKKTKEAEKFLGEIKKYHTNLIKELLKPSHQKPQTYREDRIAMGSPEEAYAYWQTQGELWKKTPGALEFLEKNAEEIKAQIITLKDDDAFAVDFFNDFLIFLNFLREQPVRLTATGNLSLKNIDPMLQQLKTVQPMLEHAKEMGWKIRIEDDIWPLHMINVIAGVMRLTHKRRDKLLLTKNGLVFLNNLPPAEQYKQIISHYWHKVNWAHFAASGWVTDNKVKLCEMLQARQNVIWEMLLERDNQWIDYKTFCDNLRTKLHLDQLLEEKFSTPRDNMLAYAKHILFYFNLVLFGCVEIEEKEKDKWLTEIIRFRSTKSGQAMYASFV